MSFKRIHDRLGKGMVSAVLLFLISSSALFAGCAIPHVPSRAVYEDPVNYVRLEQDAEVLEEWPVSYHAHPVMMPAEKLRAILSGIKVREHRAPPQRWMQGEAPLVSAFTDEELDLLSLRMSEALAEAKHNERVTFYMSQPQTFARRTITTGGLYVHGTELHFILGNWRIIYGIPAYGMIYDRRYPMRPTAAKGFDLIFDPADAVIPTKSSVLDGILANSKDELVIDLNKLEPSEATASLLKL